MSNSEFQPKPEAPQKAKGFTLGKSTKPAVDKLVTWVLQVEQADGTITTEKMQATSRVRAKLSAREQGKHVMSIKQVRPFWEIEFGASVPANELLQVTRQLAAFTTAGIPVIDGLSILSTSSKNKKMRETLQVMVEDIQDGDTLSHAAAAHAKVFPAYYISILGAAERSGDLGSTFDILAIYIERDLAATRSVRSALYYPAVLFVLGIAAILVLSTVVLPKFESFFSSLDTELPWTTQALLVSTRFIGANWYFIVAGIIAAVVLFYLFRQSPPGRLTTDRALLRIPIVGPVIKLVALERFCRLLGSLTSTGVTLPDALKLSADVMGNKAFEKAVLKTRDGVIAGRGLTEPLAEAKIFPKETVQIFRVGEQSGLLARQLSYAANYYAGEVDYKMKNLTSLIEPVVLLVIGGGTGFVAVALVSAMYGIYNSQSLAG